MIPGFPGVKKESSPALTLHMSGNCRILSYIIEGRSMTTSNSYGERGTRDRSRAGVRQRKAGDGGSILRCHRDQREPAMKRDIWIILAAMVLWLGSTTKSAAIIVASPAANALKARCLPSRLGSEGTARFSFQPADTSSGAPAQSDPPVELENRVDTHRAEAIGFGPSLRERGVVLWEAALSSRPPEQSWPCWLVRPYSPPGAEGRMREGSSRCGASGLRT